MLDRLISGAGAVTDAADRLVRALGRGAGDGFLGRRPGSVLVAAICAVLAAILLFAGIEATDNPTALAMTPTQVAASDDLGSRTYATVAGHIAATYVETFTDDNGNGTQEAGEDGVSWFYFLVDPDTKAGVAVRSQVRPADVFVFEGEGVVLEDAEYVAEDVKFFGEEATSLHFTLDQTRYIDATAPVAATTPDLDFAAGIPAANTPVKLDASRAGGYLQFCSTDVDGDGACGDDEVDLWDLAVFDPVSGIGITVLVDEDPEYTPATFTGMLRRDERAVSEAKTTEGFDFSTTGLDVSDVYLLEDGSSPTSAPLAFGLAVLLAVLAGVILIGLAGGYLIYRKATGTLPEPATSLAIGDRIPVRVTGLLRSGSGLIHVREAPADLLRFQTGGPPMAGPSPNVPASPVEDATTAEAPPPDVTAEPTTVDPGAYATPAATPELATPVADDAPPVPLTDVVASTLIVERRGRPEGVAVGLGELVRVSRGAVMPFRGRRPALRATAGTGPLLLSFDSEGDRDRAVAELLDETGLTSQSSGSAHA